METVQIPLESLMLEGLLTMPKKSEGLVIFSHGAGSSRFSPRNSYVASVLNEVNIATLLLDLLTEEEDQIYENRFNISLLTQRLLSVTQWCQKLPTTKKLAIGYFGASTGAASALQAAAALGRQIKAVVSRGGRPDLAMEKLPLVKSPSLLLVGGFDEDVIKLNEAALHALKCKKELIIVSEASHLFEEPGKLEEVAALSREWFRRFL